MNLFIEKNAINSDVTLTLSIDTPAIKSDLTIHEHMADLLKRKISIIYVLGRPLFQMEVLGEITDIVFQGSCLTLGLEGGRTKCQLYDDGGFGSAISTIYLSSDETKVLRKTIGDWVYTILAM